MKVTRHQLLMKVKCMSIYQPVRNTIISGFLMESTIVWSRDIRDGPVAGRRSTRVIFSMALSTF